MEFKLNYWINKLIILLMKSIFFLVIKYYINGGGYYGRVEVFIEKQCGIICDVFWDNKDVFVLCREKGYSEGVVVLGVVYGQGLGRKVFRDFLYLLLCVIFMKKDQFLKLTIFNYMKFLYFCIINIMIMFI